MKKFPKLDFSCLNKNWGIYAISAYFEKISTRSRKKPQIKVYENIFFRKMHNLGNRRFFGFILYLTTNFYLGMKNQIFGIFHKNLHACIVFMYKNRNEKMGYLIDILLFFAGFFWRHSHV